MGDFNQSAPVNDFMLFKDYAHWGQYEKATFKKTLYRDIIKKFFFININLRIDN